MQLVEVFGQQLDIVIEVRRLTQQHSTLYSPHHRRGLVVSKVDVTFFTEQPQQSGHRAFVNGYRHVDKLRLVDDRKTGVSNQRFGD